MVSGFSARLSCTPPSSRRVAVTAAILASCVISEVSLSILLRRQPFAFDEIRKFCDFAPEEIPEFVRRRAGQLVSERLKPFARNRLGDDLANRLVEVGDDFGRRARRRKKAPPVDHL